MMWKRFAVVVALAGVVSCAQRINAQAPACGDACPEACAKKVCVPVMVSKTVTVKTYTDCCEDYCRPSCSEIFASSRSRRSSEGWVENSVDRLAPLVRAGAK